MQMIFNLRHLAGNWTYNKRITEHLTKNPNPGRAEEDKTALEDVIFLILGIVSLISKQARKLQATLVRNYAHWLTDWLAHGGEV